MPLKRVTFSGRLYRPEDDEDSSLRSSLVRGLFFMGLDIAIGLGAAIAFFFTFSGYVIRPVEHGFYCNDAGISNPLKPNTISTIHLLVMTLAVPFFLIALMEALLFREVQAKNRIGKFCVSVTTRYLEFVIAYTVMTFLLETMKCGFGRLRPHFLDVCQPDWTRVNCSADPTAFIEEAFCTGPARRVRTARTSFPSGHTTAAVFATLFLYYYTSGVVKAFPTNLSLKRARSFILGFFVVWSIVCAVTRVTDFWHHPTDVLGGAVLGLVGAYIPFARVSVEKVVMDRMVVIKQEKYVQ
uniref:AcidPPc domain-containing protein n=1 Tax=Steinernema glaseri TaxID=37863 RepID=A0A1I7XX79_9BILA